MTTTLSLAGSYNGLTFGPGGQVHVGSLAGLDDLPPIRAIDQPKGGADGAFVSLDLLGPRTITMALEIIASTPTAYRALVDAVMAATVTQAAELPLYLYGSTRRLLCRPRRRMIPYDAEELRRAGEAIVEFVATDPLIYDATLLTATVAVAVASGGRTYNRVYPLTYGATGSGGTFQMTNAGTYPTRATAHIVGPVDNPRIEAIDQSKKIQLALSLGASDFLDIDFKNRSIVLNGTASRRTALTADSAWFDILPGLNNLRYAESTATPGSVLTFSFRSAWV